MTKFKIGISETSYKEVEVDATSKYDAILKVQEMHKNEEVVLTADDFTGTEFECVDELCPHCEVPLKSKMIDVDGTNLEEHLICPECGYGTPALR